MNALELYAATLQIPEQNSAHLNEIFGKEEPLFSSVDSNIFAWLPDRWNTTEDKKVSSYQLKEALNNKELLNEIEGTDVVIENHLFSVQEI